MVHIGHLQTIKNRGTELEHQKKESEQGAHTLYYRGRFNLEHKKKASERHSLTVISKERDKLEF